MLVGVQLVVHALVAARGTPDAGRGAGVRVMAIGAAGILIGVCAAAFLLLPVQLAAAANPRFTGWYRTSAQQHFPLASWPALFSRVVPYSVSQGASPYEPPLGFGPVFDLGLVPVLLALLATGREQPGRRSLAASFAIGGGFLLAKLFGLPPAQWIDRLPVLQNLHFIPYGGGVVALAVSGLAGIGVDAVVRRPPSRPRAAFVTAAVAGLAAWAVHFARTHTMSDAGGLRDPVMEALRLGLVAALVVAVIWLRRAGILGGPGAAALLLAAACIELVPLARQPRFYRAPVWSGLPPYVRTLQEESARSRIHGAHPLALTPNMNQPLGLEGIGSRHALNSHRYDALVRKYFKTDHAVYPVIADLIPSRRVILDLLNVKHLIAYRPNPGQLESLDAMGFPELYRDQSYVLLRNAHPWPRAYVATRVRLAAGLDGAVDAVAGLQAPVAVVLEESPATAIAPQDLPPECQIREYLPERVRIEAVSAAPAILVLSDTHMPGWTATVNGRPARILYANAAFRAVEIPAGRSEVEFRYVTPGLRAGLAVSAAALAAIAALSWPRRRRA
jgi:hypothetical protein